MNEEEPTKNHYWLRLKEKLRYLLWGFMACLSLWGLVEIAQRGTLSKLLLLRETTSSVTQNTKKTRAKASRRFSPSVPSAVQKPADKTVSLAVKKNEVTKHSSFQSQLLYYIRVDGEGHLGLESVTKVFPSDGNVLEASLHALLNEPTQSLNTKGIRSLISPGSVLNGVKQEGETVFLDFNETFQFNSLGETGIASQLAQIIYTVTEFSDISEVQFLIDGNIVDYLSPSIYTGAPLNRRSINFE